MLLQQLCPPILLPIARRLYSAVPGARSSAPLEGEKPADWYNDYYLESEEYRKPFYKSVYYPLWTVIADRLLSRGHKSINDIGCGAGQFAELLKFHGIPEYRGLDLSEEAIDLAIKRNLGYQFEVRDVIENCPTDFERFDCTVCLEFLEHVEQDVELMASLPDGHKFIGSVPNFPFVSHVRHFQNEDEVISRYGKFFYELSVSTHMGDRFGKRFFLLDGVISAN